MGELVEFVHDFARGLAAADAQRPQWVGRTGRAYSPGVGPHTESRTIELVMQELSAARPGYQDALMSVPYPTASRQKCDLVLPGQFAIEVKMLRFLGDNGKRNDNILMHILSPYPAHRSAVTDCAKLAHSGFREQLAVMVYGYDYPGWPMDPAIEAFEVLARRDVDLGPRHTAEFAGLVHPVHQAGRVFGWVVSLA